jgi:glutamyl-tRNA reductase
MQRLILLGINHTTAPLEVREKIVFGAEQRAAALARLRERFPGAEAVLLSTCNRVELYVSRATHAHPRHEEMAEFLADFHGMRAEALEPFVYAKSNRAVVEHLFLVACSLDSMVLGETQILGQVREAYFAARDAAAAGAMLNSLFQRALAVGKQVMGETALGEGRLSVASVAVSYARRIFDSFADKTVLSIGAGKMSTLVLRHFADLGPGKMIVANRDAEKAAALAGQFGAAHASLAALPELLAQADIVVSSTGAAEPIITRKTVEQALRQRRYKPVFLIDIAMPRDIEASVGTIDNVYLYNLDDLQKVVAATRGQRQGAIDAATKIVLGHVEQYAQSKEEVARALGKLPGATAEEKAHLEDLGRRIVNKILHDPIHALRLRDSQHPPAAQYLHAVENLFNLKLDAEEAEPVAEAKDPPAAAGANGEADAAGNGSGPAGPNATGNGDAEIVPPAEGNAGSTDQGA